MILRFTIFPDETRRDECYHCELNVPECDLQLDPDVFVERYLRPCTTALLNAFEEPWPETPREVLRMLDRGGPSRAVKFYYQRAKGH